MKTRRIGFKRIFSAICIVVFVAGHGFSVYNAVYPEAFPAFLPYQSETSSDNDSQSSDTSSFISMVDIDTLISSEAPVSSAPVSVPVVSVPVVSDVLTNSQYKETSEDKKQDPEKDKNIDDDRGSDTTLSDTVTVQEIITPVEPYVVVVTGDKVNLRTVMSTASTNYIYTTLGDKGVKLRCIAECTAKDGRAWRKVVYEGRELFVSAQYTEKTGESLDVLTSVPGNSSSTSSTDASSSSSSDTGTSSGESSTVTPPVNLQGWQTIEGKTYYYVNGSPITGWQVIGGLRHLFDSTGVKISKVGIDVSSHQGEIDWPSVKEAGVDFAIIRVGYRGYGSKPTEGKVKVDSQFKKNIEGATAAGIPCGVYFYSAAINETEVAEEAAVVLSAIKGYKLDYPVVYDVECDISRCKDMTKEQYMKNTLLFLETIKAAGYKPMYYTGRNFLQTNLDYSLLQNYDLWIATYSNAATDSPVNKYNYKIWQYSDSGRINGIKEKVDLNIQIKDI